MPRLMIWPSLSSCARRARDRLLCVACHVTCSLPRFERLLAKHAVAAVGTHHCVDEDAGRVDGVGVELAERVEVFDLGDDVVRAGRGDDVEVTRGAAVDEVAPGVAGVGSDERYVDPQGLDQDEPSAVQLDDLFALLRHGADAGGREEAAKPGAAAAHHLGQCALGRGDDLERTLVHRLADVGRRADMARDDLLDLALVDELDSAAATKPAVVLVDGEVPDVHRLEVVDERQWVALTDESAHGDAHLAPHVGHRLAYADNFVLWHGTLLRQAAAAAARRG